MDESKKCTKCGVEKPFGEFAKRSTGRLQSWCRECLRILGREIARTKRQDPAHVAAERAWEREYRKNDPVRIAKREARDIVREERLATKLREEAAHLAKKAERKHVLPITKGGHNTKTNVVPACFWCNTRKNNKSARTWLDYLPEREAFFERFLALGGVDYENQPAELVIENTG